MKQFYDVQEADKEAYASFKDSFLCLNATKIDLIQTNNRQKSLIISTTKDSDVSIVLLYNDQTFDPLSSLRNKAKISYKNRSSDVNLLFGRIIDRNFFRDETSEYLSCEISTNNEQWIKEISFALTFTLSRSITTTIRKSDNFLDFLSQFGGILYALLTIFGMMTHKIGQLKI